MSFVRVVAGAVVVHLAILVVPGCSLIGLGIGASADAVREDFVSKSTQELGDLRPGDSATVIQTNDVAIAGRFLEVTPRPADEYETAFAPFEHTLCDGRFPPALGDTIKIVVKEDGLTTVLRGTFRGIDPHCLYTRPIDQAGDIRVPFTSIVTIIDAKRQVVRGDTLCTLLQHQRIPNLSAITIIAGGDTNRIPLDSIVVILVPRDMTGAAEGLLLGAAVDVFVVVAIAAALPRHGMLGPP